MNTRLRTLSSVAALAILVPACGGAEETAPRSPAAARSSRGPQGIALPRARLLLDAPSASSLIAERAGAKLYLEARARLAISADGRLSRGRTLLPRGQARAVELPARLGGGWAFAVVGGAGSQIYRADTWTSELEPLVSTPSVLDLEEPLVAGFDRLYARIKSQNLLVPIDARTGAATTLGPLPVASSFGAMVFVDGWRGVVDADLRGLLATFDAGATWRPLVGVGGLAAAGGGPVRLVSVEGDPVVVTAAGRWALRGDGRVAPLPALSPSEVKPRAAPARRAEDGPLGAVPLRAALEDGWPDGPGTAVVARKGALARVSLADGATTFLDEDAFPETEASCHAMPLGRGVGFACGEEERGTIIYQLVRGPTGEGSIALREVQRFSTARRVVSSGNGALIVSGPCSDEAAAGDGRVYCARSVAGATREVRLRGAAAAERLVMLADGRIVVLVPPAADRAGQLSILDGDRATHVALRFDAAIAPAAGTTATKKPLPKPKKMTLDAEDARGGLDPIVRGTWLDGLQEAEPGVVAGWIEAGGPVAGYRVKLDGTVQLGEVVEESAALLSGPFGLAFDAGGGAVETTDFGLTWTARVLLPVDLRARQVARACGPSGCALPGTLRVGWGEPAVADDLAVAEEPPPVPVAVDRLAQRPLTLACSVASGPHGGATSRPPAAKPPRPPSATPPRATGAARAAPPPPRSPGPRRGAAAVEVAEPDESLTPNGWQALRGTPAPALGPGETGFDGGQPFEQVAMRAYAWGSRASWARTSRWLARFDDRFDALGVRSTRPTATPWTVDTSAAEQFGVGSFSYATTWAGSIDPGGRVAIVSGCTGRPCALFLAEDGGALTPMRDAQGLGFARPSGPVAQVGRATFFLALGATPTPGADLLFLHRAEGGVVQRLAPLQRPQPPRWAAPSPVKLARRARTDDVGIVSTSFAGPNDRRGRLIVVPIDGSSGAFGEPIDLGRADLADRAVRVCEAEDDGWLLDVSWDRPPAVVELAGAAPAPRGARGAASAPAPALTRVGGIEARVRVDAGSFCVESFAGTTDVALAAGSQEARRAPAGMPLAVTHRGTGERWGLSCRAKP